MLTIAEVKAAKPKDKPYRLFDGGGLYLEVQTTGARYWRWKYRNAGKERRLSLGVFPEVSIAEARRSARCCARSSIRLRIAKQRNGARRLRPRTALRRWRANGTHVRLRT